MSGTSVDLRTVAGVVRGRRRDGVATFRGVPYAGPGRGHPTGRFAAPGPPRGWTGVRPAARPGPACPQPVDWFSRPRPGFTDQPQDERCWTLDVWTPGPGRARPVLVWVHGGLFRVGSAGWPAYDGERLARAADAVVVGVNHRLDVFGFADSAVGTGAVPNVGLLDLVAALTWVREHAAVLGADPDRVVLAGQSGGAGKLSALLATPAARGLFRTAVLMSGARPRLPTADDAGEARDRLLARAGGRHAVDRLPAPALVALSQEVARDQGLGRGGSFAPWVDGTVVRGQPADELAAGAARDLRVVAGCTRDEATLLHAMAGHDRPVEMPEDEAWAALDALHLPAAVLRADRRVRPGLGAARRLVALHTDVWRRRDVYRLLAAQDAGGGPAFAYEFHHDVLPGLGATHGVDLAYLFQHVGRREEMGHHWPWLVTPERVRAGDAELAQVVAHAWTTAADPDGPRPGGAGRWPTHRAGDPRVLVLGGPTGPADVRREVPGGLTEVWDAPDPG